jgi:hypothetical protein
VRSLKALALDGVIKRLLVILEQQRRSPDKFLRFLTLDRQRQENCAQDLCDRAGNSSVERGRLPTASQRMQTFT